MESVALLLGLYEDHGVVAECAAHQRRQERLPVRLLARAQSHKLLPQVPGNYLQGFSGFIFNSKLFVSRLYPSLYNFLNLRYSFEIKLIITGKKSCAIQYHLKNIFLVSLTKILYVLGRVSEPACFGTALVPGILNPEPAPAPGNREQKYGFF